MSEPTTRGIDRIVSSVETADGAGVKLRRSIGSSDAARVDPFLMLDEFFSDDPNDYIAGFPSHPHRGFETVTYMLDGHMLHEDHLGNRGELGPGAVQWMTAGRGVIHSEMPQQSEGRMRGFQLWLNLPAAEKGRPATYRDIAASEIPEVDLGAGATARLIAGRLTLDQGEVAGPVNANNELTTDPHYLDLRLSANSEVSLPLRRDLNGFIYLYEGEASLAGEALVPRAAAVLTAGDELRLRGEGDGARLLLIAGRALNEPVVQYGPFVMNTVEEIQQALVDYREGRLT